MKKIIIIIGLIGVLCTFTSCTENQRTRKFGGTMTINVPKGMKVTIATWKQNSLFYMLEPMDSNYIPKTKKFIEDSSYGLFETKVTFIESK